MDFAALIRRSTSRCPAHLLGHFAVCGVNTQALYRQEAASEFLADSDALTKYTDEGHPEI